MRAFYQVLRTSEDKSSSGPYFFPKSPRAAIFIPQPMTIDTQFFVPQNFIHPAIHTRLIVS